MNEVDRRALGYGAVALVAVFTIYLNVIPAQELAAELSRMEPAAGTASILDRDISLAGLTASRPKIYVNQFACQRETGHSCELILCASEATDSLQMMSNTEVKGRICTPQERTGWRPLAPPLLDAEVKVPAITDALP